ncbi:MAG: hypothetical protein JWM44_4167, partial [Bacilli bacterium]|nr:hypothetical protein [Bacilli bacterium]
THFTYSYRRNNTSILTHTPVLIAEGRITLTKSPVFSISWNSGLNNQLINSYYNALVAQYNTGGNLTHSTIQNVINSVNAS